MRKEMVTDKTDKTPNKKNHGNSALCSKRTKAVFGGAKGFPAQPELLPQYFG